MALRNLRNVTEERVREKIHASGMYGKSMGKIDVEVVEWETYANVAMVH